MTPHGSKELQERPRIENKIAIFIQNFLENRNLNERVGTTLSDLKEMENGVSQGSILSVTNNIIKRLTCRIDCSLYVDDFSMFSVEIYASYSAQIANVFEYDQ